MPLHPGAASGESALVAGQVVPYVTGVIARAKYRVINAAFKAALRPTNYGLERIGGAYGAWSIPLGVDSSWVCYTVGVGEEAVFDVALAERGCDVVAIDPTPRAISYLKPIVERHETLRLLPYAIWTEDTEIEFFAPDNPDHVSFSVTNRQQTGQAIAVPARTLASIANELGHDRVDLVKLDIEGAEYSVLESASADLDRLGVKVLCVEFHNDHGLKNMIAAAKAVTKNGFEVAHVFHTDVTFVRRAS